MVVWGVDAYKNADGKRLRNRELVIDYERGRTVKKWRPRRFGGGRGTTRKAKVP